MLTVSFLDVYGFLDILLFFILLPILVVSLIVVIIRNKKYKKYVEKNSVSIKKLREINSHYYFKDIDNFDMQHSYDNEVFYDTISCKDYLTYQLVYLRNKIAVAANDTLDNKHWFDKYIKEIKENCVFGEFDSEEKLKNIKLLEKYEKKLFKKTALTPVVEFNLTVTLYLTNIRGYIRDWKDRVFDIEEIREIILRLKNKTNGYYRDREIWDAICRVERGKVSNKMRFSIYERDGYRCCKCGRRTNDLEIDHIIPISRGGKSTYDNLQTLCRSCNLEKGSDIEY